MTSMRNIASVAIVSWRQEDGTLTSGWEVRQQRGQAFGHVNRGEFEYSGAYKSVQFFQLGYDKAVGGLALWCGNKP